MFLSNFLDQGHWVIQAQIRVYSKVCGLHALEHAVLLPEVLVLGEAVHSDKADQHSVDLIFDDDINDHLS